MTQRCQTDTLNLFPFALNEGAGYLECPSSFFPADLTLKIVSGDGFRNVHKAVHISVSSPVKNNIWAESFFTRRKRSSWRRRSWFSASAEERLRPNSLILSSAALRSALQEDNSVIGPYFGSCIFVMRDSSIARLRLCWRGSYGFAAGFSKSEN